MIDSQEEATINDFTPPNTKGELFGGFVGKHLKFWLPFALALFSLEMTIFFSSYGLLFGPALFSLLKFLGGALFFSLLTGTIHWSFAS